MLIAHYADCNLMNRYGKLVAHCVVDYCLPRRHMYSSALGPLNLDDCKRHLLTTIASVRERLKRATSAFNSVMNNCPEHMIPTGLRKTRELDLLKTNRETAACRLPGEKLEACVEVVVVDDMSLKPRDVYKNLSVSLGKMLTKAIAEGVVSIQDVEERSPVPCAEACIAISVKKKKAVAC